MASCSDDTKRDDLIFDLIKRRYDSEVQRINDLDGKAHNMTGYVSIVISLLIGTGTLGVFGKLSVSMYYIPYFVGIILLVVSFLFSLSAIAIRTYNFVPKPQFLIDNYLARKSRFVTRKVMSTMSSAVSEIAEKNEDKALKITLCWGFLIAGLVAIMVFSIILALSNNVLCHAKVGD